MTSDDDDPAPARWIARIFDHPGEGPAWYDDPHADPEEPEPALRVRLLTALLRDPATHLAPYSDTQVARGLWYLVDHACSSYTQALLDPDVDLQLRLDCIAAIPHLFAEVFARRCAAQLSHGDGAGENPLATTCYMWWDLFPSWGSPRRDVDEALLSAMTAILEIESPACQESALHGLGHWQAAHPARVAATIDGFLARGRSSGALRSYALSAREGCVQ